MLIFLFILITSKNDKALLKSYFFLFFLIQMNDNQIDNWADLDELKNAKDLETVYLERNPLQKDPQYRRKIMLALPSVRQIDATFIRFWSSTSLCPPSPKPSTTYYKRTTTILPSWTPSALFISFIYFLTTKKKNLTLPVSPFHVLAPFPHTETIYLCSDLRYSVNAC